MMWTNMLKADDSPGSLPCPKLGPSLRLVTGYVAQTYGVWNIFDPQVNFAEKNDSDRSHVHIIRSMYVYMQ